MRQTVYAVHTASGITFFIEASSYQEARLRASDPTIGKEIASMIVSAVSEIREFHACKGAARGKLFFGKEFFT